jgi:hypothetical protein
VKCNLLCKWNIACCGLPQFIVYLTTHSISGYIASNIAVISLYSAIVGLYVSANVFYL